MAMASVIGAARRDDSAPGGSYRTPLAVLTSLFFMWGFITCLNDILIPHLKTAFSLDYTKTMLIQFTFFTAYFVVSLPSGTLVDWLGYRKGIIIGLITASLGCFLFYPAAADRSYPLFLAALFVLASGITLLQVSANPYVAVLGKPETASSRLNLTQAFNSLGTTVAPYFGSLLILATAAKGAAELTKLSPAEQEAYKLAEAHSVQVPYLGLALTLLAIAVFFALIKLPAIVPASGGEDGGADRVDTEQKSASPHSVIEGESPWAHSHLVLGAVAIFVYVGAEVSIGSFLVNFLGQKEIAGLPENVAGKYLSFYWGGAMVGRFIGSALLQRIRAGRLLAFNAGVAALLVLATMLCSGHLAMWTILSVGLFNSIMFPTIFTLAVARLGKHTGQGSGILCMAIVGGAVIPLAQGYLADHIGIHHAFFLPVLCYAYIAFYGLRGSTPTQHSRKHRRRRQ